ncbi:MAG TPA: reactive intermediate/imine deaminase [Ruminiclostridium sp.]|nr:reactive intermediate/imine deaminase [Ruminiclostridium sp.]
MKKIISTTNAPAAIGPYSQGTAGAGLVFVSGQLPINPENEQFASNEIEGQTKQSLKNLQEILKASGSSFDNVLKTTVYLKSMDDFAAMNKVYSDFFKEGSYPARSAVEVGRLPKDALVEIEAIALLD